MRFTIRSWRDRLFPLRPFPLRPFPLRRLSLLGGMAAVVAGLFPSQAAASDLAAWFRFGAGSYSRSVVVTETLDAQGAVTHSTRTTTVTTLVERTPRKAILRVVSTVEVAGKRIDSPPQTIEIGPNGERLDEKLTERKLPAEQIKVDDAKLDCDVRELEVAGDGSRRVVKLASHRNLEPFVARRVATEYDRNNEVVSTTTSDVVAVDKPHKDLPGDDSPTTHQRTVYKSHKLLSTTDAVLSDEVPGFVLSSQTREFDADQRELRRSRQSVVEYKAVAATDEDRPLTRAQLRRAERRGRR